MELQRGDTELESLNQQLNDDVLLAEYRRPYDKYRPGLLPRILGHFLILCGNIVYGKKPSYLKFRAVEVIARVPYHSWTSAAYTLLTFCYTNEGRARDLSYVARYAQHAQDNETMHVVVISQITKQEGVRAGFFRYTFIPMFFAFFYFWWSYVLYLIHRKSSFELNYLFEQHAFEQYSLFLEMEGEALKHKTVRSEFLEWYGRHPANQYEFFLSVRNDEIIHRNTSLREIRL